MPNCFGAAAADGDFGFLLAEFEIRGDAIVLLFADQRAHLGFAFERRAQLDALGLFRHGLDKFGVDFFLDQDAAACGADFALINEHAEERAIDGRFPIGVGEEHVGRLAAEFERDALQGVRGALDDDFADRGAAGEGDLVDAGMRNQRGACDFASAIDDVDHAGGQADFFEPVGKFHRGQRSLLRGFQNASATSGKAGASFHAAISSG